MHREAHVDWLFREITGAEDTVVVSNNAAATVLVLNTLARGREVIISRGQLVEIGGGFAAGRCHCRIGSRSADLAVDVSGPGKRDDVPGDQEEAGEAELLDDRQFVFES